MDIINSLYSHIYSDDFEDICVISIEDFLSNMDIVFIRIIPPY